MHKSKKALSLYSKWGRYWEYGVMVILDQSKKTFEFKILNFMKDNPSKLPKIKAKERKKTLNLLVLKVSRTNHVI